MQGDKSTSLCSSVFKHLCLGCKLSSKGALMQLSRYQDFELVAFRRVGFPPAVSVVRLLRVQWLSAACHRVQCPEVWSEQFPCRELYSAQRLEGCCVFSFCFHARGLQAGRRQPSLTIWIKTCEDQVCRWNPSVQTPRDLALFVTGHIQRHINLGAYRVACRLPASPHCVSYPYA